MEVIKFTPSSFRERLKYSFAMIKVAVKLIIHGETVLVIGDLKNLTVSDNRLRREVEIRRDLFENRPCIDSPVHYFVR